MNNAELKNEQHQMSMEDKQSELLDNLPCGAALYQYDGKRFSVIHINRRYWELVEREPVDYSEASVLDVVHPVDRDMVWREIESAIRQKRNVSVDCRILCGGGDYRAFHIAANVMLKDKGIYLFYASYQLISEQTISIQQMLPIALATMMSVSDHYSFVKDKDLRYICCSRSVAELLGLESERDLIGKNDYDLFDRKLADDMTSDDRRILETGEPLMNHVESIAVSNGTICLTDTSKYPLLDDCGNVIGLYGIARDVTEQKQKDTQLNLLTGSIPGGLASYAIDENGLQLLYFSDGFCRFSGCNRDEYAKIAADNPLHFVVEEDRSRLTDMVRSFCRNKIDGHENGCEFRCRTKFGQIRWMSIRTVITKLSDSRYVVNVVQFDITEQKRAEEQQSELLDNLPCGAGLFEYDGEHLRVVRVNRRYQELIGRTINPADKPTVLGVVHPDDLVHVKESIEGEIRGIAITESCDLRIRHADGTYHPYRVSSMRINREGDGWSRCVTFIPIPENMMSMQQMLPYLFPTMMEASTDITFAKDRNFRYLCCSRAYAKLLGLSDEAALVGKTDYELFPMETADNFRRKDMRLVLDGDPIIDQTETFPAPGGMLRYVRMSEYLLRDSVGNTLGVYGIGRDVTVDKASGDQLKLLTDSVPGGLAAFLCSRDTVRIKYYNDGFCGLFDMSREEYDREVADPMEYILDEDRSIIDDSMNALFTYEKPIDCVYRIRVKNGRVKWINHRATIADHMGEKLIVNAVFMDISAQQAEKEQLRMSEEMNRLAIEHSGSIITRFDVKEKTLTLPASMTPIFEVPQILENMPEEQISLGRISPGTAKDYAGMFYAIVRGSRTGSTLYQQRSTKGWRWLQASYTTIFSDQDEPVSAVISFTDVTEDREEYQQMQLERERLMLAINNLASLVISVNLTRNSFHMMNYDNFTTKAAPYKGNFDELIRIGASTCPEPDCQQFTEAFSRESLLAAYARGERKVELEHRQTGDDGIVRWMRTWVLFVDNPYSSDVYEITIARDITENRAYQALLQRSYDTIIDNMPCYIGKWAFIDGDVLLIDANRKYLEFMDIEAEEAFNHSIIYGFDEAEKAQVIRMLYACEREKKPISFTSRACKADGIECWVKVQASFFEEEDGHSVYYGTIMDITEMVAAQNKLQNVIEELESTNAQLLSVNTYRDLMNYSHDGGMMVRTLWNSENHRILYVSPGMLNICGYSEADFKTSLLDGRSSLIHPDDTAVTAEANRTHTVLGDSFTISYRIRHRDGHYIWVMEHSLVVQMPGGENVIVGMAMNISQQKELEQKFRISQEEYKIAATLSNRAVLSYDIQARSYTVISQGDSVLEFSRCATDVPERAIRDGIVAPESVETIRAVFDSISRGMRRGKELLALVSRDGTKHWEEMAYSLIYDDEGHPITAILAFDDVTAKKQAEALFNISSTFLDYTKNAVKLLVIDLTTKTIDYETEGPHGLLTSVTETKDAEAVLKYTIDHMVVPEDRERCAQFFSEEHFRNAYDGGLMEESFEYRGLIADNRIHWMNVQTRMMQDTYTKDIIVYVVFSDIDAQKCAEMELLRRAQTDSLTGLLNRESFEEEIRLRCSDPKNRNSGLMNAIVMIDIDKFKRVNDTLGHDAGDELLKEAAQRLRACLRADDLIGRFGGDEFIVLLPNMPSLESIVQRCQRIADTLHIEVRDTILVTGSVGFAVCPLDGSDFDTLLKKADTAMYAAKNAGGAGSARYAERGDQSMDNGDYRLLSIRRTPKVFARTFGYFDLFVDEVPLRFTSVKEKELLAVLIDRNGGSLTSEEAISILWENEPAGERQLTRYRKLAMKLKNTLCDAGVGDILVSNRGTRYIDTSKVECDYYQFLRGDQRFRNLYRGAYMTNYSWAEETLAMLDRQK